MWERWNTDQLHDPSMNSYNHYAYGAVADWIYRYAAGVDTQASDPGFHTILLRPTFDRRIGSVDFSYDSAYGTIRSAWEIQGNTARWNVTIPPNARGRLPLSASGFKLDGVPVGESGKLKTAGGVYELPSGSYSFEVTLPTAH